MTTPNATDDEYLISFETMARPSRYITINGQPCELADDQEFNAYQHGRLERLRRRVISAYYGADGSEVSPEQGVIADLALAEMMELLVPGAVGKTTTQRPKPTAENPEPEPVEVPLIDALNTMQRVKVMELFTPSSAGGSGIDAVEMLLRVLMPDEVTTGDLLPPDSTRSTESPPVAAATG